MTPSIIDYLQHFSPQLSSNTSASESRLDEQIFNNSNGVIKGCTCPPLIQGVEEEDVPDQLTPFRVLGYVAPEKEIGDQGFCLQGKY